MDDQKEVLCREAKPLPLTKSFFGKITLPFTILMRGFPSFSHLWLVAYQQNPPSRTYLWLVYLVSYLGCISIPQFPPASSSQQALAYLLTKEAWKETMVLSAWRLFAMILNPKTEPWTHQNFRQKAGVLHKDSSTTSFLIPRSHHWTADIPPLESH